MNDRLLRLYVAKTNMAIMIPRSLLDDEAVWQRLTANAQRLLPGR